MARMEFDTKTVHFPYEGQSGRFSWAKSDGISTNVCEQILTFIRNQLQNGQGKTGDNTEERYNGRRIIARKYRGKKEQVCVWTNACSRAAMHRKRGKYMEKEKHFSAARSLERGSLSRLPCCHSLRMRMSATAMIRPLHLFYRMRTSYRSRHPPRSPRFPLVSLRHSDLSLETKPERVPDLFVVIFQEEEVQRASASASASPCSTARQAAVTSSLSPRANQIQRGGTELKSLGRLCARD